MYLVPARIGVQFSSHFVEGTEGTLGTLEYWSTFNLRLYGHDSSR